ncbi:glycosyltransferase [Chromobacterium rhizoryzae]|uniref:glycosyltransferase n=1 Tax=Chromobacterium rhizoryzae TaxID=1778675 RepID=UPI001D072E3D|nr:glycosyltransferase [Chromobacterium rhizoryzae]
MEKRNPRIGILSRDHFDHACFKLRLGDPLSLLAGVVDTYFYKNLEAHRLVGDYGFDSDAHFVESMDAFIVQRWFIDKCYMDLMKIIIESKKPIVFDIDDWLLGLPSSNPMYDDFFKSTEHIKWILPYCSVVTVSTPELAKKFVAYNQNVVVIPNSLSQFRFVEPRERDDQVVIGFAGTSTHGRDLDLISGALLRVYHEYADAVKFVFWGNVPKTMIGLKGVKQGPKGVMYHDYFSYLADLKIDIGLAPLEEDGFNLCKSDIKWIDYAVVGAASIVSDLPPYAEPKEKGLALAVENNEDAWFNAIVSLVEDHAARKSLASRARNYILQQRTLEGTISQHIAVWNSVLPKAVQIRSPSKIGRPILQSSCPEDAIEEQRYKIWKNNHQLREVHAEQFAERMVKAWSVRPTFNLVTVVPAAEKRRLVESLAAMEKQLYPNWRLLVLADWEMPDPVFQNSPQLGWVRLPTLDDPERLTQVFNDIVADCYADWAMLLPAGFRLESRALVRLAEAAHAHPEWMAIYCDSDVVSPMGEYFLPSFKPDFSPEYLRSMDYIGAGVAISTRALVALNGLQPYPGAYVYECLLRLFELKGRDAIGHVDDVLLSLPYDKSDIGPLATAARKVALENHAIRLGLAADVGDGYVPGTHHFDIKVQGSPLVSIIIPTRDKLEFLEPCLESLFEKTRYQSFEVIIVDNRSEQPETREFYEDMAGRFPGRIKVAEYDAPFNFSAQCNLGVSVAAGEFVLLLNNDTEVILESWLERLLAVGQQSGVGAVGARLLYPEVGQIQHAGIILGLPGGMRSVADHVFEPMDISESGYQNRILTGQNYSAVTGACLLVSKEIYLQVSGLDEDKFKVCFNDVDFCLKVQAAGYRNVYNPFVVLYHHHAKSIGRTTSDPRVALQAAVRERDEMDAMLRQWLPLMRRDPFFNRHLSLRGRKMEVEWQRCVAWDPELPGRKRVLGMPVPGGSGEYRLSQPLSILQEQGRLDGEIHQPTQGALSVVEMARHAPDTLLLHTGINDGIYDALTAYREFIPQMRVVFGIDDLVGGTPVKSNLYDHWKRLYPDAKQRLRRVLKLSDALVVSTEPLAAFTQGMVDEIVVVPNRLRKSVWGQLRPQRRVGAKPRVGWVGASQHRGDLELLFEVIKQTAAEVDWVFMGMCLPQFRPYVAEVHHSVPFDQYPEAIAKLNLDLAVAPLELNAFNEAKSNLRLLEYGALGWPVVCTDIYPYQTNAAPVCRVPNVAEAWIEAIRSKVYDRDASEREGEQLRDWVERHYWLEDHHEDWFHVLHG